MKLSDVDVGSCFMSDSIERSAWSRMTFARNFFAGVMRPALTPGLVAGIQHSRQDEADSPVSLWSQCLDIAQLQGSLPFGRKIAQAAAENVTGF